MRGGQQGAKHKARTKICTVRHEHGIYGDERSRLTNNKSKGSKARSQGILQVDAAGQVAMRSEHRWPEASYGKWRPCIGFCERKYGIDNVFLSEAPGIDALFHHETEGVWLADVEVVLFVFLHKASRFMLLFRRETRGLAHRFMYYKYTYIG